MLDARPMDPIKQTPEPQKNLFSTTDAAAARRSKAWLDDRIKRAAKLPENHLFSETVKITPVLAELILEQCNTGNRTLKETKITAYVQAMKAGRWKLHSQGISFARNGMLNNGQNRLTAVVRSGVTVDMYVAFNEDRSAYDVLDTGKNRNAADALHQAGFNNTHNLAAAIKLLDSIENKQFGKTSALTNEEVVELAIASPGLRDAVVRGSRISKQLKCSSAAAAVACYLIARDGLFREKLPEFVDRLVDGLFFTSTRHPVRLLREGLKNRTIDKHLRWAGLKAPAQCASIIKAWNLFVHGRSKGELEWSPTEAFPSVE